MSEQPYSRRLSSLIYGMWYFFVYISVDSLICHFQIWFVWNNKDITRKPWLIETSLFQTLSQCYVLLWTNMCQKKYELPCYDHLQPDVSRSCKMLSRTSTDMRPNCKAQVWRFTNFKDDICHSYSTLYLMLTNSNFSNLRWFKKIKKYQNVLWLIICWYHE